MQIKKEQLQRQQKIMKHLGFYRHSCDGIWGPESIAAKKSWESDPVFVPALPNGGLPFADRDPTPKGVSYSRTDRMFFIEGADLDTDTVEEPKDSEPQRGDTSAYAHVDSAGFYEQKEKSESDDNEADSSNASENKQEQTTQENPSPQPQFKKKKKHR